MNDVDLPEMAQIRRLLSPVVLARLGEPLREINQIVGRGSVNDVYLLATETKRTVARLGVVSEVPRYRMEASLAAEAAEAGLPTPRVFCVDRLSDRAMMLLEYVPGTPGDDPGIDPDHVWRSLGAFARFVHSIPADEFGERFGETIPTHTSWEVMLEYNIRRHVRHGHLDQQVLDPPDHAHGGKQRPTPSRHSILFAPAAIAQAPTSMPVTKVIVAIVLLGVVCTALAFLIFFALIAETGPVRATMITYVNPTVAVVLGVVFLGESFTAGEGVGFALILTGLVLATRLPASDPAWEIDRATPAAG